MDCRSARELYIGSVGAPDAAVAEARAHVGACPACRERLDALAAAALSRDDDEISCAECLGRVSRSGSDEPVDAGHLDTVAARHLQVCPLCAAVVAELAPTLVALRMDQLPEAPRYPAVDTSFLRLPAPGAEAPLPLPEGPSRASVRTLRWSYLMLLAALAIAAAWQAWGPGGNARQEVLVATSTPRLTSPAPVATTAPPAATRRDEATTPAATPRSTSAVPTAAPASPSAPPTPVQAPSPAGAGPIALLSPATTDSASGLLRLAWTAPALAPGTVFDVRVCKGADCQPALGRTNTAEPVWLWCPDEGAGTYRWQVVVVDSASKQVAGPSSDVAAWSWSGGECAESPSPAATALPEPTSEEPPPEP